jgi:hypothetical protein
MTESLAIWNSGSIPRVVQKCHALISGEQCMVSITKSPVHPLARVVDASEPITAIDLVGRLLREGSPRRRSASNSWIQLLSV